MQIIGQHTNIKQKTNQRLIGLFRYTIQAKKMTKKQAKFKQLHWNGATDSKKSLTSHCSHISHFRMAIYETRKNLWPFHCTLGF